MLSTESVDDSKKMTGLRRREVLGIKKGKDSKEKTGGRSKEKGEEKSDDKSYGVVAVERV